MKGSVLVRDWKFWGRNKLLECSRYFFPFAKSSPDCIKFDFKLLVVISVFLPGCFFLPVLNRHDSFRVIFHK